MKPILYSLPRPGRALCLGALILSASSLGAAEPPPRHPSEMLERGIYLEEFKGNLDEAITIYQQLLADVKASRSLAAQAQFRLALCLQRKNRTQEATAAFERVVKEYPAEKELVAKARANLPAELTLLPAPWEDGELLQMTIRLANGMDVGVVGYSAERAEINGQQVWRVGARMFSNVHSVSSVFARLEDFQPLSSRWMHGMLGDVAADYHGDNVVMKLAHQPESKPTPVDPPVFDNEQAMHLMRRLPLSPGYKASIKIFSTLGGGATIPIGISVAGIEPVETAAGKWNCFKVELSPLNQTFWFSADAKRLLVKFEVAGARAELTSIHRRKSTEPVHFSDETGVSFTAPGGWLVHKQQPGDDSNVTSIYLLDPEAQAHAITLKLYALSSLSEEAKKSPQAWAESNLKNAGKHLKALKTRDDGWQSITIAGLPAIRSISDYEEGKKKLVLISVHMLGANAGHHFGLIGEADKLEAVQPAFEQILASFKTK